MCFPRLVFFRPLDLASTPSPRSTCAQANGATFQFIEPQRPWSLVPWAFQEHDPSVAKCGAAFRNQTRDFATHAAASVGPPHAVAATLEHRRHKASELSVWRAVFGKGAIETNKRKREKRKKRHEAERTRMAVVYNCFAHLESIARFPRPVGSCVFVLLARCRARLAWTYPYDLAITIDILPPNTPSTQALEVMNCYAEEAPDRFPTSACRRGCCFSWPFDALISTQARGGAQARARRRRRVVALRARRHGPRAAHVGGPGAFPASFFCFCVFVLVASRSQRGLGAVTGQSSSRPQYDAISR